MNRRTIPSLAIVATVVGLATTACSTDAPPTSPSSSASVSSTSPSVKRPAPGPPMSAAIASLAAAYGDLNKTLSTMGANQKVTVAITPVGDSRVVPIVFGDNYPAQVAWSTIKVPLALAAERHHGAMMPATVAAITASDNSAAQTLWESLGTPDQAAAAVRAILTEAGDRKTVVPSVRKRPPYSVFGQTVWAIDDSARFTAGFACLPDSGRVRQLMGRVDGNQQWGAESMTSARRKSTVGVKGGWGPGVDGGYVVRQIALITHRDGSQTAVAMTTFGAATSMGSGIAALNHVGKWLQRNAAHLPRGYC